jgi:hypothetical protein
MARSFGSEQYNDIAAATAALETLVRSLTGVPGRKAVLHVSDGLPLVAGWGALNYARELCDGSGAASGVPYAIDLGDGERHDHVDPQRVWSALAELDTTPLWQDLAARANLEGVTFFTFETSGLAGHGTGGAELQTGLASTSTHNGMRRNRQDTLSLLAGETGGRAFLDENDVGRSLSRMLDDLRSYWLVSFRPPAAEAGTVYRLRVETTRPGVTLRYRRSYRFRTQHERVGDRLLAALLHDTEPNPLGVALESRRSETPAGAPARARLRVSVPLQQLTLLGDGERSGQLTIFVAALRHDGATTDVRQASRWLRLPAAAAAQLAGKSYVYEVEVPLPPGEHLVGVAVVDELTGTASFARQKVEL